VTADVAEITARTIVVDGNLIIPNNANLVIKAHWIWIRSGSIELEDSTKPFIGKLTIEL